MSLTVQCACCRERDDLYTDDRALAEELAVEGGWRRVQHWTLCDDCYRQDRASACASCCCYDGVLDWWARV